MLKLIGLHGLAYSEDEAETFKAAPEQGQEMADIADARTRFHNCMTRGELRTLFASLPSAVRKALKDEATALADNLP